MNNMMPGGPNMPPAMPHHSRRHENYHYAHHPPHQMQQYQQYMQHPGYGMPPPQYYPTHPQHHGMQWYPNPYQQMYPQPQPQPPPPPPQSRAYPSASPMVVSGHMQGPNYMPYHRPQQHFYPHMPQQSPQQHPASHNAAAIQHRTPQPPVELPATPSTTTQQAITSPSTTPTTASVNNASVTPDPTSKESPVVPHQPIGPTVDTEEPSPAPVPSAFFAPLPFDTHPGLDLPFGKPRRRNRRLVAILEFPLPPEGSTSASADPTPSSIAPEATASEAAAASQSSLASSEVESSATVTPASSEFPVSNDTQKTPVIRSGMIVTPALPRVTSPAQVSIPAAVSTGENTPTPVVSGQDKAVGSEATLGEPSDLQKDATVDKSDAPAPVPAKPPSSWAALLRSKASASNAPDGDADSLSVMATNGLQSKRASTLADALRTYDVDHDSKMSFLEPRGLVNTGNMCYMNSVLQVLVFCAPFYEFLDQVSKRAAHSFKSETPLVDAMIMFMREFNVIDSATSPEQLRLRLKDNELEQYGEAFIPEFVYEVIKQLPRFASMRRGHQQDAEEFLGFLLEGLHDECTRVIRNTKTEDGGNGSSAQSAASAQAGNASDSADGWLEVGPKQKAAVTRSSGDSSVDTPITKIFGGKLRSEFRVPGLQNSVTLEPYQPLQLDIGEPKVSNITDALRGLTRSETIHGEFNSPRGPGTTATKQVFIDTLPPVLILHLKRFQYDNTGGTQKIWKKVGYPLELEIPKEVFPQSKRAQLALRPGGLPKYRLIGVVYHHGKNASGGHYTVDVRRQDGLEWIRLDDTVIRRVRAEDVAREGGEEDPKVLAAALENHKRDSSAVGNKFSAASFDVDEDEANEDDGAGWRQVNGRPTSPSNTKDATKKWSSVANGASTGGTATPSTAGKQTPRDLGKFQVRDNKVAYILFYERIKT